MSTKGGLVKKGGENHIGSSQIFTYLMNPVNKVARNRVSGNGSSFSNILTGTSNNRHSNFLYVYFQYAYYLLLIPFRFRKVREGKYEIYRCLPQQVTDYLTLVSSFCLETI